MTPHASPDLLEQVFILPADATLVALADLSPRVQAMVGCRDGGGGQVAVSRPGFRVTTRLITPTLAALLQEFRQPSRLTDAVLRFSRAQARDPFETLEAAFDALAVFIGDRVLVSPDSPSASALAPSLGTGQALGEYEVERLVSALVDTEVYQALTPAGTPAAIKFARRAAPEAVASGLAREARILEHLGGGYSPALIEHGVQGGRSFIAMEWRSGVSVAVAAHQARASLDRRRLHRLCANLLSAYGWLHERGVIHGDIHPGNICVAEDGGVTILDVGRSHIVQPMSPTAGSSRLQVDTVPEPMRAGVPYFYEPEIARALHERAALPPATEHGEQYSLAALLYYLLTGVHYVDLSPEHAVLLGQIIASPPLPFVARGLEPWPQGEAVLATALSKDPAGRFASVVHFRDAFLAAGATQGLAAVPRGPVDAASRLLDECLGLARAWDGPAANEAVAAAPAIDLAWFTHRAAQVRDDPELMADADVWACRAHAHGDSDWNVDAISAEIHRARGDTDAQRRSVSAFLVRCEGLSADLDYLGGRSGALTTAARLLEATATSAIDRQPLAWWARRTVEEMWRTLDAWPVISTCRPLPHLGMAHGWAGVLFATLRAARAVGMPPPSGLAGRLEQLARLARPGGRGVCWPGTLPLAGITARTPSMAPGWCSGSAGHVWLWALAHEQLGEPRFRALAERAGWHAADHAASNPDFCCGTTGRGFALLRLYQATGAAEWLAEAQRLAHAAAVQWRGRPGSRSLRTGTLGTALLLVELEAPERTVLPMFGQSTLRACSERR